jgi:hypothetical protein
MKNRHLGFNSPPSLAAKKHHHGGVFPGPKNQPDVYASAFRILNV